MAQLQDPITQRDFSAGRIAKTAVATALMPNYSSHSLTSAVNSVSNSINVDFSEVIGSGIVRKGKNHIFQVGGNGVTDQNYIIPNNGDEYHAFGTRYLAQTFTPGVSGPGLAISLQMYITGNIENYLVLHLQGVSGGLPNGVDIMQPVSFDVSQILQTTWPGAFYSFYLPVNQYIIAGTPIAIVLEYPNGDVTDSIAWMRNGTGTFAGQASYSTDGGSTWTTLTGAFCFKETLLYAGNPYNLEPLGNYSFLSANIGRNVVAFDQPFSNKGVIYYWDYVSNTFPNWRASTLSYLNASAFIRFANMNGSVFEANGIDPMHDSADFGATWGTTNSITTNSVIPSLLLFSQGKMLASGYSVYPNRLYFSSLVDPASSPFITWNTDPSTGDFIDIDSSAGSITGLVNTSTMTLVFTTNGMYRLSTITKSIDAENVFNVGIVKQEAITSCQGLVYFYSGEGIYSTDSTFPQQISRIAVQDFIDAIADPKQVFAWADEFNVYFSIGAVTIQFAPEDFRTYSNVVLKFSPRDQNWQVFAYNQRLAQTTTFGPEPAYGLPYQQLLATEYDGFISFVNTASTNDDGQAIPYEMETQELEFGDRSHTKNISDKIVVFTRNGNEGSFSVKQNDGDFKSANMTLENRVNVGANVNFEAQFFTFKWKGEALGSRPIFEGFHLETITDLGVTENNSQ